MSPFLICSSSPSLPPPSARLVLAPTSLLAIPNSLTVEKGNEEQREREKEQLKRSETYKDPLESFQGNLGNKINCEFK